MHNRKPDGIASREIGLRDGLVLAPLVLCILGLALYPQLILHRTAPTVQQTVASVTGGPAPEAQLALTEQEARRLLQSAPSGGDTVDVGSRKIDTFGVSEPGESP